MTQPTTGSGRSAQPPWPPPLAPAPPPPPTSWPRASAIFLLWGLAAASGMTILAGAFTIGIYFIPPTAVLVTISAVLTDRRPDRSHCVTGLILGPVIVASVLVTILLATGNASLGWAAAPYVWVGVGLVALSVALFVVLGLRTRRGRRSDPGQR